MNRVVKKVRLFFPGLLQKKIIVFSTILVSNHWRATFDFNAGGIDAVVDNKSSVLSITCFMMSCEPIQKMILGQCQRSEVWICRHANGQFQSISFAQTSAGLGFVQSDGEDFVFHSHKHVH
jgi:hypothetical protein